MNRYTAFISYRHLTPDAEVAQKLHRMINEHTTDLNEIATTYQQSEQRAVQAASSLKVNNIS